jgi:NAD(P)-dependent dehydrogenase (short-subunit alcohol dehydrogenase family)
MGDRQDKTVVATGAASGQNAEEVGPFATASAQVIATDINDAGGSLEPSVRFTVVYSP